MSDKEDKFFAVSLTFIVVLLGLFGLAVYASLLLVAPIATIVASVVFWYAFKRVYPRVLKWLE